MIASSNNTQQNTLAPGTQLGKHGVRYFIAHEPLGDRYAVLFGTTNRVYDVNVSFGGPSSLALSDFGAIVRRTTPLRHPCLIPYFACGEDDGVAWIRSEHSDGVPDWVATSILRAAPHKAGGDTAGDDKEVCFTTLRALLDATGNRLSEKDSIIIIGDLAEVLAYLHSNRCHAGVLTPETVFLDRTFRHTGLIARLRFYAGSETMTPELVAEDLRQVGVLISLLMTAYETSRGSKLVRALSSLAVDLQSPGAYSSGMELYDEVRAIFEDGGAHHQERLEKPETATSGDQPRNPHAVDPQAGTGSVAAEKSRHRSGHHRHKKPSGRMLNANSGTGQIVATAVRITLMFAGIVGIGFAVFFGMKYADDRRRANTLITSSQRYSAISIPQDENATKLAVAEFPENVLEYTSEQLKAASSLGDAVATARLAILELQENPMDPAVKAGAGALLEPQMSRLEVLALTDAKAAYWYGYVRLLGLCRAADPGEAVSYLQRSVERGNADAGILLGDWLANRNSVGNTEDDRQALQYWRTAYGNPSKWTGIQYDAMARIVWFVRRNRGVKGEDADLAKLVESAAGSGYVEAILLISELYDSGRLVPENPSNALSWLRRITSNDSVEPALRAEAQRRMADMFTSGRGTPASLSAARIWYERSAKLGNVKAMEALAQFCETGQGAENGKRDYDEALYWRDKAKAAPPPPPPANIFRLLPGAVSLPTRPAVPRQPVLPLVEK